MYRWWTETGNKPLILIKQIPSHQRVTVKYDRIKETVSDSDASFQCDTSPYKGFMKGARASYTHGVCL